MFKQHIISKEGVVIDTLHWISALYQFLSKNNSLEHLELSCNAVASCHPIAARLAVNKTLKRLDMYDCELTDHHVKELLIGLVNNIEILNINNNEEISEIRMKLLARHLTTHCPKLNTLYIPHNLLDCTKTMFKETNEERKRNRLHQIDVSS